MKFKFNLNQKAQMGETITWFVAVIVIFFILFLFFGATSVLSGKKSLLNEENEILFREEYGVKDLNVQSELFKVINFPLHDGRSLKDLIFVWAISGDELVEKRIEKEVIEVLKNNKEHIFRVNFDGKVLAFHDFDVKRVADYGSVEEQTNYYLKSPVYSSKVIFFLNGKKLNITLYVKN